MSNPLKMKKMGAPAAGEKVVEEDLSEVDEEEEKKMAIAYTEVNRTLMYAANETQPGVIRNNKKKKQFNQRQVDAANSLSNEDNQSVIADCAMDCETNRINNDNYRLDMTYADQEMRRRSLMTKL